MWGVIKKWCVVAITASMTMSCGASWHLKRAIAKDPTIARDTIVRVDTTIVTTERRVVDTLVVRDTIVREIKSNGARVRIQRLHDTIRVDVCVRPIPFALLLKFQWTESSIKQRRSNVPCWTNSASSCF